MNELIEFKLEKDKVLFQEGDDGNYFYILKEGNLDLIEKGEKKKTFGKWDCFGELALLQKCKRTATVKSSTEARIYFLDGHYYRDVIQRVHNSKIKENLFFVDMIPILKSLDIIEKKNIAEIIVKQTFSDKERIICNGELGTSVFIIKEGVVSCRKKSLEIRKLYARDYFGEHPILADNKRTMDVVSVGTTVCYEISLKMLEECLGKNYKEVILFSLFSDIISKNTFFNSLLINSQILGLFRCFEMRNYRNNEVVYEKGNPDNKKISLVLLGSLVNVKNYTIKFYI